MQNLKLSSSELNEVSEQTKHYSDMLTRMRRSIDKIVEGTHWHSSAADTFRERWKKDRVEIIRMRQDLERWSELCKAHADLTELLNRPFGR